VSHEIDELVKRCVELREAGRIEEAIISARRATSVDPESANAWWQLALAVAEKDGDAAALEYFKQTVELADQYGYGWHRLGTAYKKIEQIDEAVSSWETACEYDGDYEWTRYNLVDTYNSRKFDTEKEKLFKQLVELESRGKLRPYDYHLLAIAHHNNGNYLNAIPYYKKYLLQRSDQYGYTNLSLSYSSQQVGQDLDAADCCHLALQVKPDFETANNLLANLTPKLEKLKVGVSQGTITDALIPKGNWFENYLSPFELLQIEQDEDTGTLEIREIQKARKILIQEIELEDGVIEWVPNLTIDKSRAIKLADELNDEKLRFYHQQIYDHKPLLNFLSRGDLNLFLYDQEEVHTGFLSTFAAYEDFAQWLSEIFSKQYDTVFTAALASKNIDVIKVLLSGRRFVTSEFEDKCFTTGVRYCSNLLHDLTEQKDKIEKNKPTIRGICNLLDNNNLRKILEVLPPAFIEIQSTAAETIRSITVEIYRHHDDAELAKEVLALTSNFAQKSAAFRIRFEKDLAKLNELIEEEKKDESVLNFGDIRFEIKRDGVRHGGKFIKATDAETLRWGITVNNSSGYKTYDFKIAVGSKGGHSINLNWNSGPEIKKQEELFQKCVDAIFAYILPNVIEKLKAELTNGKTVYVGDLPLTKGGLILKAPGWFGTKDEYCPWRSLNSEVKKGSTVITSSVNSKAEASLSLADIDNAWILRILIKQGMMK